MTTTPGGTGPGTADELARIARQADGIMLFTLAASALAALAIGQSYGSFALALQGVALIGALALFAFFAGRGTALGWVGLTFCNVAMVALHIQLGRGTLEFHFGVFVLLGLLLVYRDWRPIVLGAGLFALHHIGFDRLQASGLGVYCTPEADFLKVLMHAGYVVVQTGVELFLALQLRRAAVESAELVAIVQHIDRGDTLCLDMSHLAPRAPTARVLKQALDKMALALRDVSAATASIETASSEIAAGNLDLSQRTEVQASNLQQTAASMEQVSTTVASTADSARRAHTVAATASTAALAGGEQVDRLSQTMAEIASSSRRIADINAVIDGIAFQTNILALNAAVEAARAGEQGRGFAVVAAEVRLLAQRSATAAREIKALIGESVAKVELGAAEAGSTRASMGHIVEHARQVSELLADIARSAQEQNGGIAQIGRAVTDLDAATQQNSALVEQGAAASESLRQQARRLSEVVQRFALDARAAGGAAA